MNFVKKLWREEEGQGLTEYAIIVAALVVVVGLAIKLFGNKISAFMNGLNLAQ